MALQEGPIWWLVEARIKELGYFSYTMTLASSLSSYLSTSEPKATKSTLMDSSVCARKIANWF